MEVSFRVKRLLTVLILTDEQEPKAGQPPKLTFRHALGGQWYVSRVFVRLCP